MAISGEGGAVESVAGGAATGAMVGGPWGAVIGGGLGLIGSLFQNKSSAQQAQQQQEFQERMSNTAHQREVLDLQKAGLNPILSANKGASTPSGAMAPVANVGEATASGAASGQQIQNMQTQRQSMLLQQLNTLADTDLKSSQSTAAQASAESSLSQARLNDLNRYKIQPDIAATMQETALNRAKSITEGGMPSLNKALEDYRNSQTKGQDTSNESAALKLAVQQMAQKGDLNAAQLSSGKLGNFLREENMFSEMGKSAPTALAGGLVYSAKQGGDWLDKKATPWLKDAQDAIIKKFKPLPNVEGSRIPDYNTP